MKVKKFRIRPRLGIVARLLKSTWGVKQLPPELEDNLQQDADALSPHLSPTAFYQTWHGEKIPLSFQSFLDEAGLKKAIAVSALVATIGSGPEETISESLMEGDTQKSQVIQAICNDLSDVSFNFIYRLLNDDAKTDDCEISSPIYAEGEGLQSEILELLEAGLEEIHLDNAGHLSPRFTKVALVAWLPASKKKRTPSSSKKK